MTPVIVVALIIISGVADSIVDTISFHYKNSVLPQNKWWGERSWVNKWKTDEFGFLIENKERKWYYLWLIKPLFKEAFPFSSTLLVSLTDAFHTFKNIRISAFILVVVVLLDFDFIDSVIMFFAFKLLYGLFFEIFFSIYLQKRK